MRSYILGGGVTGLAAGISSGLPVFEGVNEPGGICSSYYVRPGEKTRLSQAPNDEEAYRFEIGGGHWIFGGDPTILQFLRTIAPLKSYLSLSHVIQAAFDDAPSVGYNVTFVYPAEGLNTLAQRMASGCDIRYGKRAVEIDIKNKEVAFADGTSVAYNSLLSTLPLNTLLQMTGIQTEAKADPHTAVLVLNIGARRGEKCPDDHWLYNPDAKSGFHRVGFYSNVDRSFLPKSARRDNNAVSIYVERAYVGGAKPTDAEVQQYANAVVRELQEWGYITEAEVVDPTWIDVAYTWSYPNSPWKKQAMQQLEEHSIYSIGRYGRWVFQGIADSVRDGFYAGASFKTLDEPSKIIHLNSAQQSKHMPSEKILTEKIRVKKLVPEKVAVNGTSREATLARESARFTGHEAVKVKK